MRESWLFLGSLFMLAGVILYHFSVTVFGVLMIGGMLAFLMGGILPSTEDEE